MLSYFFIHFFLPISLFYTENGTKNLLFKILEKTWKKVSKTIENPLYNTNNFTIKNKVQKKGFLTNFSMVLTVLNIRKIVL